MKNCPADASSLGAGSLSNMLSNSNYAGGVLGTAGPASEGVFSCRCRSERARPYLAALSWFVSWAKTCQYKLHGGRQALGRGRGTPA